MGRAAEAVELLSRAQSSDPGDHALLCQLAYALLEAGRPHSAEPAARRAIAADPAHEWGYRLRGLALWRLRKRGAALEAMRRAVALQPYLVESRAHLSYFASRLGHLEEAMAVAERAVTLFPQQEGAWWAKGWAHAARGEWARAEATLRRGLALNPSYPYRYSQLGYVLARQGRTEEAVEFLQRALVLMPGNGTALYSLARALAAGERYEEAREYRLRALAHDLEATERVLASDPSVASAHFDRSVVLYNFGRRGDALASVREAVRLDAEDVDAWIWRVRLEEEEGDLAAAEHALATAVRLEPGNPSTRSYQAWLAMRRRDPETARLAADKAEALRFASDVGAVARGHARMAAGEWDDAERSYREAVVASFSYCCRRSFAGIAAGRAGRVAAARADMDAALAVNPHCGIGRELAALLAPDAPGSRLAAARRR